MTFRIVEYFEAFIIMDTNIENYQAPGRLKQILKDNAPKRKYASYAPDRQRAGNAKRKQSGSSMKYHVDYYYKTESEKVLLMNKLDLVKVHLGQGNINKSTNYLALCEVLDWYISCNLDEGPQYQ